MTIGRGCGNTTESLSGIETVARYKQQIIDDALAQRRKPIHVIPQRESAYNPGEDNSPEAKYRQLLEREERPTADFEIEAL